MKRYSLLDVFKDVLKYIWIAVLVSASFQIGFVSSVVSYNDLPKLTPEVFANQDYYVNKAIILFLVGVLGVTGVYGKLYILLRKLFKK